MTSLVYLFITGEFVTSESRLSGEENNVESTKMGVTKNCNYTGESRPPFSHPDESRLPVVFFITGEMF